jgi:hypothetical protein
MEPLIGPNSGMVSTKMEDLSAQVFIHSLSPTTRFNYPFLNISFLIFGSFLFSLYFSLFPFFLRTHLFFYAIFFGKFELRTPWSTRWKAEICFCDTVQPNSPIQASKQLVDELPEPHYSTFVLLRTQIQASAS